MLSSSSRSTGEGVWANGWDVSFRAFLSTATSVLESSLIVLNEDDPAL